MNKQKKYSIHGLGLYQKVLVINPKLQSSVSRDYLIYSDTDIIGIQSRFTLPQKFN